MRRRTVYRLRRDVLLEGEFERMRKRIYHPQRTLPEKKKFTLNRTTRKQIEAMSAGSPEQARAADEWMQHFMSLWLRTAEAVAPADWWRNALQSSMHRLMKRDVWQKARQRWSVAVRRGSERIA